MVKDDWENGEVVDAPAMNAVAAEINSLLTSVTSLAAGALKLGLTADTAKPGNWLPLWGDIGGKPAVIAAGADQASARNAIGAGTSNLVLGTTPGTAKAGDWQPAPPDIAAITHAATEKPAPSDADDIALMDSGEAWNLKRITWGSLKSALLAHVSAAAASLANKTLVSPTINSGRIIGSELASPTVTGTLPWSAQAGAVSEAVGTPGRLSVLASTSAGSATASTAVMPLLQNAMAYHLLRGGTATVTINGVSAAPGDYAGGSLANVFAPNSTAATLAIKAVTDVVVVECDFAAYRTLPMVNPIAGALLSRWAAARDVSIEIWDGTAWQPAGSVTGNTTAMFAARSAAATGSRVRYTFTNFTNVTQFTIISLWAVGAWNDNVDGFGGFMPRTGGQLYGSAASPPGFTATGTDANIPIRQIPKGAADFEVGVGIPAVSLVAAAPANGTAAGRRGQVALAADGNSLLVCVTTGAAGAAVWKRLALANF